MLQHQLPLLAAEPRSPRREYDVRLDRFPATRYQGSKRRLLSELQDTIKVFNPRNAVDLYSGTASISLLMRKMGWIVTANDYMRYNQLTADLMLNTKCGDFNEANIAKDLSYLLLEAPITRNIVQENFRGIYFTDQENTEIDRFCQNIGLYNNSLKLLYTYAVGQALLMKRPYNLFHRANLSMRLKDVKRSFGNVKTWNSPIIQHASKIAGQVSAFPFPATRGEANAMNINTMDLSALPSDMDLVYLDPPYLNSVGIVNDYSSFYHFLDGLCDYELFNSFDYAFSHRPINLKPSAWGREATALDELDRIIRKWPDANIILSYRNDGKPSLKDIMSVFDAAGRGLTSSESYSFKYALSHSNETREMILVSSVS